MADPVGAGGLPPGFSLIVLDEAGSTNDEAARLALSGAGEFTLCQARRQTGGRGRQGRVWSSPEGNLYQSMVLRPRRRAAEVAQISLIAGLALTEAVAQTVGTAAAATVKWPNDVLLNEAKVAGVLLEASLLPDGTVGHVILGTGVNIAHHPAETPYPATHVQAYAPAATVTGIQAAFCGSFAFWYSEWQEQGFAAVRQGWLKRAWRLGELVRLRPGQETVTGRFLGIDDEGAMLLETADGVQRYTAGDMFGLPV